MLKNRSASRRACFCASPCMSLLAYLRYSCLSDWNKSRKLSLIGSYLNWSRKFFKNVSILAHNIYLLLNTWFLLITAEAFLKTSIPFVAPSWIRLSRIVGAVCSWLTTIPDCLLPKMWLLKIAIRPFIFNRRERFLTE